MLAIVTSSSWEYGVLATFAHFPNPNERIDRWAFETPKGVEHGLGLELFDLINILGKQGWRYHEADIGSAVMSAASSRLTNHVRGFAGQNIGLKYWLFEKRTGD